MSLAMILFWGTLAVVAVWLMRRGHVPTPRRAANILAERFARGEIDDEEYNRRRLLLHETESLHG